MNKIEINDKIKSVKICAYGTLRLNHGNWSHLLKDKSEFLGTYLTSPYFTMYSAGGFPIVTDNGNTEIEYDLFEIKDNDTLNRLHRLEGCTGIPGNKDNWYDIIKQETPHGIAYMYVMHNYQNESLIKSGNWNKK